MRSSGTSLSNMTGVLLIREIWTQWWTKGSLCENIRKWPSVSQGKIRRTDLSNMGFRRKSLELQKHNFFDVQFSYSWASLLAQLVKNPPAIQETWVWLGRSPGEAKGYSLQYSGLKNPMNYRVHGVAKSGRWLNDFHFHIHKIKCETYISVKKCVS